MILYYYDTKLSNRLSFYLAHLLTILHLCILIDHTKISDSWNRDYVF